MNSKSLFPFSFSASSFKAPNSATQGRQPSNQKLIKTTFPFKLSLLILPCSLLAEKVGKGVPKIWLALAFIKESKSKVTGLAEYVEGGFPIWLALVFIKESKSIFAGLVGI